MLQEIIPWPEDSLRNERLDKEQMEKGKAKFGLCCCVELQNLGLIRVEGSANSCLESSLVPLS